MVKYRRWLLFSSVVASVLVLTGVGWMMIYGGNGPPDQTWHKIQHDQRIVVAIDPSYPPFANYGDPEPIGIDPDLAHALGAELGVDVHFSWQGYDGLYDALLLRHADMIISAIRPDPLRTDQIYYTSPYFDAGYVLVGRRMPPRTLNETSGLRIAVEFASEGAIVLRRYPDVDIQIVDTSQDAIDAVIDGLADFALVDRISGANMPAEFQQSPPIISDPYVIALRREDWKLALEVEKALVKLEDSGILTDIVHRWLTHISEL